MSLTFFIAVRAKCCASPDVIVLQEFTPEWRAKFAANLWSEYPHRVEHPEPGYAGICLASRLPMAGKLGYAADKPLKIKVSTRNIAVYRDPAVILIDQLKEVYIDGELEVVETANWFSKVARKDYTIGLIQTAIIG